MQYSEPDSEPTDESILMLFITSNMPHLALKFLQTKKNYSFDKDGEQVSLVKSLDAHAKADAHAREKWAKLIKELQDNPKLAKTKEFEGRPASLEN